jgi:hypothetical protein
MDEMQSALDAIETLDSEGRTPGARLLPQERLFCAAFVMNGGNGTAAAEVAGYLNPAVMASRLLARKRVAAMMHELSRRYLHAALPVAISTLLECCQDTQASWKERRAAAAELLKLDSAGRSSGPSVAVQVNVGKDDAPSEVLRAVWEGRAGRLSSIAAPMPDSSSPSVVVEVDADDGAARAAGWAG